MRKVRLFSGEPFSDLGDKLLGELHQTIVSERPEYLLNVNEVEYAEHLVARFGVEPLSLSFDDLYVSPEEVQVRAEEFPSRGIPFGVEPGRSYRVSAVICHVPYSGDARLFSLRPNPWLQWSTDANIAAGEVRFQVLDWNHNAQQVKSDIDATVGRIRTQCQHLAKNVEDFNTALASKATEAVSRRRAELLAQNNLVASLGLPVMQASNVPTTFAIPTTPKRLAIRPRASAGPYQPEPTLDQSAYQQILNVVNDTGRAFERHPSTYAGKDEETLRDHLILLLESHFESTTAETFNKSGKTDILIRHEHKNAFVAECKFWSGEKAYLATIDQLLGYLTWRDSKAAVILFIRNKEIDPVLATVERCTPEHSCFVMSRERVEDGWFGFDFHLPDDPGRGVTLAVLCFHLP